VADLNGDGNLDLVVANLLANQLSVLLGKGDGTFSTQALYTTGFEPAGIAIADFNGDGKLDLATSNNGTVSILLGNGDGTFQRHRDFLGGPGTGIAAGDFNLDGKLDIAVSLSEGAVDEGEAALFLGNGDGTLQPQLRYSAGVQPAAIAAGSFVTSDGLDFVVANTSSNSVSVFFNAPLVAFYPPSFNFGNVNVGSSSTAQILNISNPGSTTLTLTSFTLSSGYSQAINCPVNLAPGAFCSDSLTFKPTVTGTDAGSLMIGDSALSSPQALSLTGVGVGPQVMLSPTSLSFGVQVVGTTSPPQTVTLTNTGTGSLTINNTSISAGFTITNNGCPATVKAGNHCTIQVAFSPGLSGAFSGTLSIADNAQGSPQTVSLSGTGTVVNLAPTSIKFGTVKKGSSKSENVTLTNEAKNQTLTVTSITFTGADPSDFSQTGNCVGKIGALQSCTIMVTFTPQATGSRSATMDVNDNGGGSPQTVSLSGTGQ
jgi:hypothetical protein